MRPSIRTSIPRLSKKRISPSERLRDRNGGASKKWTDLVRSNVKHARTAWGVLPRHVLQALRELALKHPLSVAAGELQLLDGRWYVTHAGLMCLAQRSHCAGIRVQSIREFCDASAGRWVFKATVYKSPHSRGFVGFGDADPSNVSLRVRGAEMRVAETRAVNRALRKAYGIGLCSVEELGWAPRSADPEETTRRHVSANGNNGHHHGQPRLRDRLCLLIRQYQLDPNLVKAYAADYCGTAALKDASRDLVEAFINDLAERATKDREGLLCHLNSYAKSQEVHS
jgi:hypothetical protein